MKYLVFMFFLFSFSHAHQEWLYTKNTRCVYDLVPNQSDKGFCYKYSDRNDDQQFCNKRAKLDNFIRGYVYKNGECDLKYDLKLTGMDQLTHDQVMFALSAALGTLLLFSLFYFITKG